MESFSGVAVNIMGHVGHVGHVEVMGHVPHVGVMGAVSHGVLSYFLWQTGTAAAL